MATSTTAISWTSSLSAGLPIDPKRLVGERGFDFANIFCNPDMEIATAPGRLARQADVVGEAAGLKRIRLLKWIVAYAGLSAAWILGDGEKPTLELSSRPRNLRT